MGTRGFQRLHSARPQDLVLTVLAVGLGLLVVHSSHVRLVAVAAAFCLVAWKLLIPQGWLDDVDRTTKKLVLIFVILRLLVPIVVERVIGVGDALGYHLTGSDVARDLADLRHSVSHRSVPGTGAVDLALGYFYVMGTPVQAVATYLWSSLAGIGTLLFWWGTRPLAGDRQRSYAAFIFFTPTLLLWNGSVGKEAPLTLAIACLAASVRLLARGVSARGTGYFVAGVVIAALIRPHVALLIMTSVIVALGLGRRSPKRFTASSAVPLAAAVIVLVALVSVTEEVLDPSGRTTLRQAAYDRAEGTATIGGGSGFEATPARSVTDVPAAIVTVLFRPFPWEVKSLLQALTSLEVAFIGAMFVLAAWRLLHLRRAASWTPLLVLSVTFVVVFCVAFSSLGNFGLLARQRSQVLPFVLCVIAAAGSESRRRSTALSGARQADLMMAPASAGA